jgi:hypothetical protein
MITLTGTCRAMRAWRDVAHSVVFYNAFVFHQLLTLLKSGLSVLSRPQPRTN